MIKKQECINVRLKNMKWNSNYSTDLRIYCADRTKTVNSAKQRSPS